MAVSLLGKITSVVVPVSSWVKLKLGQTSNLSLLPSSNGRMAWSCKKCTFINSPSRKTTCQICQCPSSPPSTIPSSSLNGNPDAPVWSCKACTFLNPYKNPNCEICGARAPLSSISGFDDFHHTALDGDSNCSVGSVFLPLRPCKRKVREEPGHGNHPDHIAFDGFRGLNKSPNDVKDTGGGGSVKLGGFGEVAASSNAVTVLKKDTTSSTSESFKILSYNVWFREDLEVHKRMKALGELIQLHLPDIICFQEVTPNIYDIFRQSNWWKAYCCSVSQGMADSRPYFCMQLSKLPIKSFSTKPFSNSIMGRELCIAELEVQGNKPLVVATSHLESPCPAPPKWDQMFSKERVVQAKEAINLLKKNPNTIFCGDMNWDDKLDGQFPLADGWIDAWAELRPGDDGWTYDTKCNQMLSGNRSLRKRLDRFVCNLRDFRIHKIDMVGKEAIPGLSYTKEKKVRKEVKLLELPVLPSDHYGLLLTFTCL